MKVSVIITCWNGRKLLEKNLPYVLKTKDNPKNKIKEILVVDDASTDDSVAFLRKNYPEVNIVEHQRNLGYAAACNTGVREAKGDLVVILNLDVVPSVNFLEAVLPHFENKKIFAVSFNEGKFGPGKLIWKNGFLEIVKTEAPKDTVETDWPSGGSAIFRKDIWQKLGGMDELFLPFYFEDIDLGIRAQKAGYQCLWEPKARVDHQHEATINPENFSQKYIDLIKQRNHLLLTWKNINNANRFFSHFLNLIKRCLLHPRYLEVVYQAFKRMMLR